MYFPALALIPFLPCALVPLPQEPGSKKLLLRFEQVSGRRGRVRFAVPGKRVGWAEDGVHLRVGRERLDPLSGEERQPVSRAEPHVKALAGLLSLKPGRAKRLLEGPLARHAGGSVLLSWQRDLYFHEKGQAPSRLTRGTELEELAELAPDGRHAAFVRNNDLFLIDTASGKEQRVTNDGGSEVLNGKLDWVYQEEVYGRGRFRAHWWSPDSRHLAFLRLHEKRVPRFPIVDSRTTTSGLEQQRYPKPGQPNPQVALGIVAVPDGRTEWVDLSAYPEDCLIVRVGWHANDSSVSKENSSGCVFMVQDRIQTWLELVELVDGSPRTLLRESSSSWVSRPPMPEWQSDGSFLWLSERSGQRHLYHFEPDGKLRRQITRGDWSLRSLVRADEKQQRIWFTANKDGAVENQLYRIRYDGQALERVTQRTGWHRVSLDKAGSLLLDTHSSLTEPRSVRVLGEDGSVLRVIDEPRIPALDRYQRGTYELSRVPARDGYEMDVLLLKPSSFDPGRRYPVWMPVYAGPGSQSVRNRWRDDAWDQFIAGQGYLVFRVNNRSASGRGQESIGACYKRLGVTELEDIEDALGWLCKQPWADGDRVGISGWSYGGFMAAYALTHSKKFKLGVAGAGVYDWRLYDSIYTERYMALPATNRAGYDLSSCIKAAGGLSGHLVVMHGTRDDNVHMQNAMQLIDALQRAGKHDFELMLFPGSRHGLRYPAQNEFRRSLTWRAMQRVLGDEKG